MAARILQSQGLRAVAELKLESLPIDAVGFISALRTAKGRSLLLGVICAAPQPAAVNAVAGGAGSTASWAGEKADSSR